MLGSKLNFNNSRGRSKKSVKLEYFRLSEQRPGYRIPPPRSIYKKKSNAARWACFIFFLMVIVLAFVSLGKASPPLSRGARPIALGGAYTAEIGDVYSLFYNPGALAELNQKQVAFDFGRSHSELESARSEFNGMMGMPYRYRGRYVPLAFGFYGEGTAPGAHIIDLSMGGGMDAPVEKWTRGFIKFPVKLGAAVTLRHQNGHEVTERVGDSAIGFGLTLGAYAPWDRNNRFGMAIRNLYMGDANPAGATINWGWSHRHKDYLNLLTELEYGRGGVWRFKPGLEWLFYRGVLKPRLGWGFRDNGGVDSVATGLGFNLSPLQIDLTYLIPLKTLNDNAGQFRASVSYRFGHPQFTEIYYDQALEQASQLDQRVLQMTVKEAELKNSLKELNQKRRMASEEIESVKARIEALNEEDLLGDRDRKIKELESKVKALKSQLDSERSTVQSLRSKKASIRIHVVKPGETLQSIARKYYGDPNQWKKIYNRNSDSIERGLPVVGSKLVIP